MSKPLSFVPVLLAGGTLLLVVHGLGRFVYTPLLPGLVEDGVITVAQGANIATWNYLGYLLGALLALRWHRVEQIHRSLPWALGAHVLTTFMQTQAEQADVLAGLRLANGIANGLVFVQAPALVLEWLACQGQVARSGLVYLGVCLGLLVSSLLVSLTDDWLTGAALWWPAAILSVPLAIWGWQRLARLEIAPVQTAGTGPVHRQRLFDRNSTPLFLAYAGAGLGYILPMTFLPMLASLQSQGGGWLVDASWLIVALAALPSPWLWNRLGARIGDDQALKLSYAVQLAGVLAVLTLPPMLGLPACGVLVGSAFLGTVLLTQRLARTLHPHQGPRLSAALIALYGLTQLAGPWLTGLWMSTGGGLQDAFWFGAGALTWGLAWMLAVPRHG
ncbi:YbfB/YjiJ family MFS transporter [Stutzerimonas urumqiensis]|uniref:YbfB/YjiJ family MFS transporter n=1 Tax=Stutzerimonas urumqiensis TaxID=638269 RepID=UPI003DA4D0D5